MEPNIYRTISDNNRENLSRVPGWFCFDFTLHGLRGLNTAKSISKALYGLSYLAGGARLLGVHHSHGKKALQLGEDNTGAGPNVLNIARTKVLSKHGEAEKILLIEKRGHEEITHIAPLVTWTLFTPADNLVHQLTLAHLIHEARNRRVKRQFVLKVRPSLLLVQLHVVVYAESMGIHLTNSKC
ncbi:predicted protein [Histoplasma capsulatum G186AR]|uniref:Uncharacterized protein n=1 Tax=Ajellomyces capsulatus (strain G186AR / H82 / ATCC MYA-2454 / RMSCC 2432) TaxID=447093 RepID=C0NJF9_AJECG|nr:uncharacterized protein HCBG_03289 [Histoplasma capsulatum G186AR]EEH08000.1 predicted protein [Histoplasma capsulatum G186AR]